MLRGETTNINVMVFGLIQPRLETANHRTRGEHTKPYTTDGEHTKPYTTDTFCFNYNKHDQQNK
jgi:hypothetical protein